MKKTNNVKIAIDTFLTIKQTRGISNYISRLSLLFKKNSSPKFRVNQVLEWIWKHYESDFNKMTNIGANDIDFLNKNFIINKLEISTFKTSLDGTIKFLFEIDENRVAVKSGNVPIIYYISISKAREILLSKNF